MIEVYSGIKPGKPKVLLAASLGALLAAMALAWVQVQESRALAPQREIPGTPLLVRPPQDWIPDPKDSSAFLLPVRRSLRGQEIWEADRRLRFSFEQTPGFTPPTPADLENAAPIRIGPFPGFRVQHVLQSRWGRQQITRELMRCEARLPSGERILVEYVPMQDLTVADLELIEHICAAVQVSKPRLTPEPQAALRQAGLQLEPPKDAVLVLPPLPVPGVFIGGTAQRLPTWSLGCFRTWLASGRTPEALLADLAANQWLARADEIRIQQETEAGEERIFSLHHRNAGESGAGLIAAWLKVAAPERVLLVLVYTDAAHLSAAETAVRDLLARAELLPLEAYEDLAGAEAAGLELVEDFAQKGALPWWGRRPARLNLRGEAFGAPVQAVIERDAAARGPEYGYVGRDRIVRAEREEVTVWQIDGHASTFKLLQEIHWGQGQTLTLEEERTRTRGTVQRTIERNGVRWRQTKFEPGPRLLIPPLELIAASRVARMPGGPCLVEGATHLGEGAYSLRMAPLERQEALSRVLIQYDFWPMGAIQMFDETDELHMHTTPTMHIERVD